MKNFLVIILFFGRISEPAVELANKLIEISPFSRGKVFFTNSGSEANDTTVKLLWFINKRKGKPHRRKNNNSYQLLPWCNCSFSIYDWKTLQ
jgi:adenosylmethionine-8-amino-7-oxononanoate aminotransferase